MATVAGHRSGDNPARWAGNLKELLQTSSKGAQESNHPTLQLGDTSSWCADIQGFIHSSFSSTLNHLASGPRSTRCLSE